MFDIVKLCHRPQNAGRRLGEEASKMSPLDCAYAAGREVHEELLFFFAAAKAMPDHIAIILDLEL